MKISQALQLLHALQLPFAWVLLFACHTGQLSLLDYHMGGIQASSPVGSLSVRILG